MSIRIARRASTVIALALLIVGAWSAPAFAHAVLEGTQPGSGATVQRSPRDVTLTYSEPVEASLGAVRVFDSRARQLDVGNPEHPGGDARVVRVSMPDVDDGTYAVTWRVLSADAHPIRGAFTFTVGESATTAAEAQSLADRLLTDEGGSPIVGVLFAIARFGAFFGMAVLIGAVALLASVWRSGRDDRRARRIVWTAWGATLGFTLAAFALQGPYAGALDAAKALDPSIWSEVWETRFGRVHLARVAILVLALPVILLLLPRRGPAIEHPLPRWWPYAAGAVGLALCVTPGLAGHASSGLLVPLAIPADTLHVAGVGIWLGGLVVLFAAFMPRADEPALRHVVPRYSRYALIAMGVIVLTGVFQAFRQIDRFGALLDTDYGRILLIKVSIFLVLLVVAAVSRDVVNRRWRIPTDALVAPRVPVAALSGRGDPTIEAEVDEEEPPYPEGYVLDEPTAERRLRRSLLVEVLISILILAVTALLVNAAPARDLETGPYLATLRAGEVSFDVTVTPAIRGANEMHLFTLDPSGGTVDPTEVTAQLSQPENDIAPIDVELIRLAPGHYTSANLAVPFAGDWELTVRAVVNEVEEETATATVPISS